MAYDLTWEDSPLAPLKKMPETTDPQIILFRSGEMTWDDYTWDAREHAIDLEAAIAGIVRGELEGDMLCALPSSDDNTETLETLIRLQNDILRLAQSVTAAGCATRLWLVASTTALDHGLATGFGQSMALEAPDNWGGCILIEGPLSPEISAQIRSEIQVGPTELVIKLSSKGRQVRRLRLATANSLVRTDERAEKLRHVWISGGTGALGVAVAKSLAAQGCKEITLIARQAPGSSSQAQLAEIKKDGTTKLRLEHLDISDTDAVRQLAVRVGTPDTVVHAAGSNRILGIGETTSEVICETFQGKLGGVLALDTVLPDTGLVVCSSISAVWGSGQQAHYAAANALLDAFAARRAERGALTTTLNFGPFASGMADPDSLEALSRMGLRPLELGNVADHVTEACRGVLQSHVLADVDWNLFKPIYETRPGRTLFQDIETKAEDHTQKKQSGILSTLLNSTESERPSLVAGHVRAVLSQAMNH